LSLEEPKNEEGKEDKRWEGVLKEGKAFWSLLRASWPADRDRFRVGPKADSNMPRLGRSRLCL
jgi:hypothetical protein